MPREIRSAPLRYGLAIASFALILLASFGLERVLPLLAAGYQTRIKKPVDPTKQAAAVASLGKKAKK